MKKEKIAARLDAAADLIEKVGWWNARTGRSDGAFAVCAQLAIRPPWKPYLLLSRSRNKANRALESFVGEYVDTWNDSFNDPQPVLDGLRACAMNLRMEDNPEGFHEGGDPQDRTKVLSTIDID